jgi:type IV secretory pathway TraG/TraD family ATPase VirD4
MNSKIKALKDKNPQYNIVLAKNVALSINTKQHGLNLNTLVVGGVGCGKTRHFVIPNIKQANTSFVIHDPHGEILRVTEQQLTEEGYEIKILNLLDPAKNVNYNEDDVDFGVLGQQKVALFIMSGMFDNSLKHIATETVTQIIDTLIYDSSCSMPVQIRFIFDELACLDAIPDFELTMKTINSSSGLSFNLSIQNINQLKLIYPETWGEIAGACDNFVYMGCNCVDTQKYVSQVSSVPLEKIADIPRGSCLVKIRGYKSLTTKLYEV